ncbi:hypothetical protein GCM10023405_47560 [Streptomonospora salina]
MPDVIRDSRSAGALESAGMAEGVSSSRLMGAGVGGAPGGPGRSGGGVGARRPGADARNGARGGARFVTGS